ncbi:hypothetical protein DY000_02043308 [Brassica cretica]|uniref:Uncharacterized protein n=1 Tax=Brassica cretica TaxID=69181 RepID=A0ABQ7BNJ8_BRACR|nr:hypothetical protein DY000_02043308 [Brassica cretica]
MILVSAQIGKHYEADYLSRLLGKIDSALFWCEYGSCTSPLWLLFVKSMCFKDSEHYNRTIPPMNVTFDDQLTHRCSLQTPLISTYSDHNDQRFSFDSGKSLWFHHGNAGIDRFCWELCFFGNWSQAHLTVCWCGGVRFVNVWFISGGDSSHPSRYHYPNPAAGISIK